MLVAATKMYGSGGQAAFGSLGVSDEGKKILDVFYCSMYLSAF